MRRFEFTLEVVLRWRRSQLDMEELKLRRLLVELADLERRTSDLESVQSVSRQHVQSPTASLAEREGLAGYLRWSKSERENLAASTAECCTRIASQRTALVEARRRYELLDKLKMRRHDEWEKALAKEVEDTATEAFLARWHAR